MKPHWILSQVSDQARRIASEFKIHPAIASILVKRGLVESADVRSFLNPTLDSLEDPFAFSGMQKAVDRIREAISNKEKILIYGDYDVDGITGSAILYPVLKKMGAEVGTHIPHRIEEGYGLNKATLERLLKQKYRLVITVDNGITGVDQIRFLCDQKVDTIVVDHHLPKGQLPPAYAIVSSSDGTGRGDPNLAACGIAFKLAWALTGNLEEVKNSLDLVAVGTVADMANVMGDNRVLIKHGLSVLAGTQKVGLRALMDTAGVTPSRVNSRDIAFGLGPRINASGRMGSPETAFKLLTTDQPLAAQNLAQILEEGNRDRQRVESLAFEEAMERVEGDFLYSDDRILVLDSADWHEGVLGIVASRLVEKFNKPSIVVSHRNGVGKGSGRSTPDFSLFDCVSKCEDLLMAFGGHAQACGLSIAKENVPLFRSRLNEAARQGLASNGGPAAVLVDEALELSELDIRFLKDLETLAPFGPGNRKPLFVSRGLRLKGPAKKLGKDTLQGWVTDEREKTVCEMIGFRRYDRWMKQKSNPSFDLVYQPTIKNFNGTNFIQLEMEDWS